MSATFLPSKAPHDPPGAGAIRGVPEGACDGEEAVTGVDIEEARDTVWKLRFLVAQTACDASIDIRVPLVYVVDKLCLDLGITDDHLAFESWRALTERLLRQNPDLAGSFHPCPPLAAPESTDE